MSSVTHLSIVPLVVHTDDLFGESVCVWVSGRLTFPLLGRPGQGIQTYQGSHLRHLSNLTER